MDLLELAHHALGCPDGPHITPYRNYFAIEAETDTGKAFEESPYWETGRTIPGGLTYYRVTDAGRAALWIWLRDRQKAKGLRPYTVTVWWSYYDAPTNMHTLAKSRSAAKYDAFRQLSDTWCDLTFRQFCGFRISARAA